MAVAGAGQPLAVGQGDLEAEDVVTERARAPVVLAVDVRRSRARYGYYTPTGDDGRAPAVGQDAPPEVGDGHARLDGRHTGRWVPDEDAVGGGAIQRQAAFEDGGVAVAVPAAAQADRRAAGVRLRQRGRQRLSVRRAGEMAPRAVAHPPAGDQPLGLL